MSDTSAVSSTRELLQSLIAVVRIALNNGVATLYASILLLAIGLCCVRGLWERIGRNGTRSEVLHQLTQAPQEPLRPDTLPMLSSAVLGKDIAAWSLCGDRGGAGRQVGDLISQAAKDFWGAYERKRQRAPGVPELKDVEPSIDGLPPAQTDKVPTQSPLTLPSALHDYWPDHKAPDLAQLAARVQASLDGLEAIRSQLALAEPTERAPGAIRFFFVSVDGFMRYTPSLDEATPTSLPPHRTFHHTSYVLEALGGPREGSHWCGAAYETVPYFDILGGGVVMTTCRRMPEQVTKTSPAQGVLCTDVALPRQLLLDSIKNNPLIDADFFVYDETTRRLDTCARVRGKVDCNTRAAVPKDSNVPERVQEWLKDLQKPRPSGYAGASPLTTLAGDHSDHSYDYAAVLWRETKPTTDGKHTLRGIALFNIPPYTFDRISWAWLGGAVLCLIALVYLLARQRVALANARVFALQRGLSVGVVWVDRADGIIGVNDRAEFLIGEKLPRLGLLPRPGIPRRGDIKFKALLALGSIVVREGGALRVRPYEHIDKLRKEGVCSVYWIRLNQRKRWLKATGAPVFEPGAGSGNQPTVGLLEPAEHSMQDELEGVLNAEAKARAERSRAR